MSKIEKIHFTKETKNEPVVHMVALYDSEKMTKEEAMNYAFIGTDNNYIVCMKQTHYDSIICPAMDEAIMRSKDPVAVTYGQILYYYDKDEDICPEKCRVDGVVCDKDGWITSMSLTFFDKDNNETDFDVFGEGVMDYLFKTADDAYKGINIIAKGGTCNESKNHSQS